MDIFHDYQMTEVNNNNNNKAASFQTSSSGLISCITVCLLQHFGDQCCRIKRDFSTGNTCLVGSLERKMLGKTGKPQDVDEELPPFQLATWGACPNHHPFTVPGTVYVQVSQKQRIASGAGTSGSGAALVPYGAGWGAMLPSGLSAFQSKIWGRGASQTAVWLLNIPLASVWFWVNGWGSMRRQTWTHPVSRIGRVPFCFPRQSQRNQLSKVLVGFSHLRRPLLIFVRGFV